MDTAHKDSTCPAILQIRWSRDTNRDVSSFRLKIAVRGFSVSNIKNMRQFYEEWQPYVNRQPMAGDLQIDEYQILNPIRPPMADELDWNDFAKNKFKMAKYCF
jgi:hypothetical protein